MQNFGMTDLWQQSLDLQQNMVKKWLDITQGNPAESEQQPTQSAPESTQNQSMGNNPFAAMAGNYQNMYANWQRQMMQPMMQLPQQMMLPQMPQLPLAPWQSYLPPMMPSFTPPYTFTNSFMNNSRLYTDLFNLWQKNASTPITSPEQLQQSIEENQRLFEKMAENFIMPFIPETMRPVVNQIKDAMRKYAESSKDAIQPLLDLSRKSNEEIRKIMEGDCSAYTDLYKNLNKIYIDSFNNLFGKLGMKLSTEQNEEIKDQFVSFFKMMLVLMELMSLLSNGFKESMSAVFQACRDSAEQGNLLSIEDFYTVWVKINRNTFAKMFGNQQFSQLLGELFQHAYDFRSHCDKIFEKSLIWTPFSQMMNMFNNFKPIMGGWPVPTTPQQNMSNIEQGIQDLREEMSSIKVLIKELYRR